MYRHEVRNDPVRQLPSTEHGMGASISHSWRLPRGQEPPSAFAPPKHKNRINRSGNQEHMAGALEALPRTADLHWSKRRRASFQAVPFELRSVHIRSAQLHFIPCHFIPLSHIQFHPITSRSTPSSTIPSHPVPFNLVINFMS